MDKKVKIDSEALDNWMEDMTNISLDLTDRDAETVEELIENPSKPNKSLKRAKKSHKKLIKDDG